MSSEEETRPKVSNEVNRTYVAMYLGYMPLHPSSPSPAQILRRSAQIARFDRTLSSQEEIDTGDLSRAGPAYEAIEDRECGGCFSNRMQVVSKRSTVRLRNILDDGGSLGARCIALSQD